MRENRLESVARWGVVALQSRDFSGARNAFEQVTADPSATAHSWLLLAQCCGALKDEGAEEAALDAALALEPENLLALLAKGDRCMARGDERAAVTFFTAALRNVPADVPAALTSRLERAQQTCVAAREGFERFLEQRLAGVQRHEYFQEAIDIMLGRKPVQVQQPTSFFYPGLPQRAFYDARDFPWTAGFENQVDAIEAEYRSALDGGAGLHPYVQRDKDRASRGHALLDDDRWSALDLWREGAPVASNAGQCPSAMAALHTVPMPVIVGRSPMALFSVLQARTHIPPHTGMLNTRLICHLPLIVPEDCVLRVGNHQRKVERGRMMIFDDTLEHEAWNASEDSRVVLLFEVWRPELGDDERSALVQMFESIAAYG